MAWQKTKPASSDLISTSQADIQGNFAAVEEGTVPGERWQFFNGNPPAAAVADTFQVYSKDVSSKAELHGRDEDNNEIVMSSAGRMGSPTTDATFQTIRIASDTFDIGQDNIVTAWATITAAGAVTDGKNVASVTLSDTSKYKITWSASTMSNSNYAVIGMSANKTGDDSQRCVCWADNATKDTSEITLRIRSTSTQNKSAEPFFIAAFGGR